MNCTIFFDRFFEVIQKKTRSNQWKTNVKVYIDDIEAAEKHSIFMFPENMIGQAKGFEEQISRQTHDEWNKPKQY